MAIAVALPAFGADEIKGGKWIKMFNGKDLTGWQANEHSESWVVEDGMIKGHGPASHLFWMTKECENCEFRAKFKIGDKSNSGMYFRTAFGPGFPKGYEAQVNATHKDPVKTGSLYNFHKNFDAGHQPDEWVEQDIIARGNHIIIKVNGKVITDYVDEKNTYTKGYLALQQHDPGSTVYYKELEFRTLQPEKK